VAVEQGGVHGGFQVGKPLADGRCRDELALCRAADAAELAHRHKELQRGQVNAARKTALGAFHGVVLSLLVLRRLSIFHPIFAICHRRTR
jgi:hypothetical protein